jgi:hypothetical protein
MCACDLFGNKVMSTFSQSTAENMTYWETWVIIFQRGVVSPVT